MRDDRPAEIQRLIDRALALPPADRADFLDAACADDPALRREIESGLRDAESTQTLTESASRSTSRISSDDLAQDNVRIGSYRILRRLGEGGMGVVYEAQQERPRRRVAVKVVRGGQLVSEVRVRMFQREADALARLKHPNIGAIYEAGRTDDGQHFFAMELVRGETLDAYMRRRPAVTTGDELRFRMALFRKIADAVHYAHQRGVIHRDLKPSNIVVTEEGAESEATAGGGGSLGGLRLPDLKILDFGLARITEGDLAATMTTETGVIKGTLPYMSPEQARGRPDEIDVRSDVYALGVILYEMLSGRRPYDVAQRSLVEALRVICDEPPVPLARTMGGTRKIDSDIETIAGKALEKEPERRYASAAALSEDVARWLTSQPILARPPSAAYQLRKFAGRNKTLVGGVVATFVVLLAGVVVASVLGLREARQRRAADVARSEAERVGYVANIAAAEFGLRNFELAEVKRRLEACPPELRGWEWRHLARRTEMSEQILTGHTARIYSVAVSPDGSKYASSAADPDNTVRLWDAATGRQIRTLSTGETRSTRAGGVRSVSFSPDGKRIAWGSDDGTVRVSRVIDGAELLVIDGHEARVNAVAYTPDGHEIVSGSFDRTVKRWDAETGQSLGVLRGHDTPVWAMALCGSRSSIVSGDAGGVVRVWERASGRQRFALDGLTYVLGVACTPDSTRLATTEADGSVRVWKAELVASAADGRVVGRHEDSSVGIAFSPDGRMLVTTGKDRTVRLWDAESGQQLATLVGHDDVVTSAAFSPDGTRLITASWDRSLRVWNADPAQASPVFAESADPVEYMAVTSDGTRLVYEDDAGDLNARRLADGADLGTLIETGRYPPRRGFALSEDGTRVAAIHEDQVVRVWSIAGDARAELVAERTVDSPTAVAFVPDSSELLIGTQKDGVTRRWDFASGESAGEIATSLKNVMRLAVGRDGSRALACGGDWSGLRLELLDLKNGASLASAPVPHIVPGTFNSVGDMAFSPDGSLAATVHGQDYALRLWSTTDLALLHTRTGHTEWVRSVNFSPDGTRIVTGGVDYSVRVWDGATGAPLLSLRSGDREFVTDVTFTPDGKTILSAERSGRILAWRTEAPDRPAP